MALYVNITKKLDLFDLDVALTCPAGAITVLVGPSGAGKSMLTRVIAGLERPDAGTVSLNGGVWADAARRRHLPTHKRGLGMVFQGYTLFPHLSVEQNVCFGARDPRVAAPLMERMGIARLAGKRPHALSGGERQRAALCQALASDPALLLLDEPFSALDVATRHSLCDLLLELKADLNVPILHVTHDLEEAERLGDAVLALERGRLSDDWFRRQRPVAWARAEAACS